MNKTDRTINSEMPTIQFGNYKISKLIMGGNPISGNSHFSEDLNRKMLDYCSEENVINLLKICEENEINIWQSRGDRHIMRILHYHRLRGGKINWIGQTASELADIPANIREMASHGAIAVYHHGTKTDECWEKGEIDKVNDMLKVMRDAGILVGMGSHKPEPLEYAEEKGWDVDFFMLSLYDVYKKKSYSRYKIGKFYDNDFFNDADRERMLKFIRQTDKICLAYKILGAGRKCNTKDSIKNAFEYALKNIKKKDAVVVGMYLPDQPVENAQYVRTICSADDFT